MPENDPFGPALVCRPALPKDTPDILELTKTIWDGNDYVPYVWQEWLDDPQGLLAVAELGGRVAGCSKLSLLAPGSWWLQGLRVDPALQGRGIASRLHKYLLDYWLAHCDGALRLGTASFRLPVQHLCERTGFRKAGEFTYFSSPALDECASRFTPLPVEQASAAVRLAQSTQGWQLAGGYVELGWEFIPLDEAAVETHARRGDAWLWSAPAGGDTAPHALLLTRDDDDEGVLQLAIGLAAAELADLPALLADVRCLAAQRKRAQAVWLAPLLDELLPIQEAAGYRREWKDSLYLYERLWGQ